MLLHWKPELRQGSRWGSTPNLDEERGPMTSRTVESLVELMLRGAGRPGTCPLICVPVRIQDPGESPTDV